MLHIMVSDDSGSQLSEKHWKEFALPYLKRLFDGMPEGVVGVIHNCSRVSHLIEQYIATGAKAIQFGEDLPMEVAKERVGDKMCLFGNMGPLGVMSKGSPGDVIAACKDLIEKGGPGGGYILSSSGSVNRDMPLENLEAMVYAAEEFGTYPIGK